MPPRITPVAPTRIQAAFDDPDFVWELKHDGFKAVAYIEDDGWSVPFCLAIVV
jgi:hypothetical protein